MIVRAYQESDLEKLRNIHEAHYKSDFSFDDFAGRFIFGLVVADDEDNIICAGGVRNLAEVVMVSDKDVSTRKRREALLHFIQAGAFLTKRAGFDKVHAFVEDDQWRDQLARLAGFKDCKNKAIFLEL